MRLWRNWRRGHLGTAGLEPPETEATLRAALAEPAAPGEDESYRRLMAVIADDMRLRQPAPQPHAWGWIPAVSVGAATAILAVLGYVAGVDHGMSIVQRNQPAQVAVNTPETKPKPSRYVQPEKPVEEPALRPTITEVRPHSQPARVERPAPSPMNYVGRITTEGLNPEQRELLRMFVKAGQADDWETAARNLRDLADTDPDSDVAVSALHGAAQIYDERLHDAATALDLYQKEAGLCRDRLTLEKDAERRGNLETQLDWAQSRINALTTSSPDAPAPDPDKP